LIRTVARKGVHKYLAEGLGIPAGRSVIVSLEAKSPL
jgi:hypothetical protein